jgi:N,N-dimethylformamidase
MEITEDQFEALAAASGGVSRMSVVGYADCFSVEQGGSIGFMVSSEAAAFEAGLVRLIHGDTNPAGPGFKCEVVDGFAGEHRGRVQPLRPGSYVHIPQQAGLAIAGSFSVHMWLRATTPDTHVQTLISSVSDEGVVYAVRLDGGRLSLQVGADPRSVVQLGTKVAPYVWYSMAAVFDAEVGEARLSLAPLAVTAAELADAAAVAVKVSGGGGSGDVLLAAELVGDGSDPAVGNFYNGKIDAPRLFERALDDDELAVLRSGAEVVANGLVAAWDFTADIRSSVVSDVSGNGLNGRTVNKPMRAATGWNWDGSETAWTLAPHQYGAIHFHDDDLDDAGWEQTFRWTLPDDLPSGVYAAHLSAAADQDFIPFVVRPTRGRSTAKIVFVVPIFSYLAYGNELTASALEGFVYTPEDRYIVENRLRSLYHRHSDGSGVCYSSRLRPVLNMRPKYVTPALNDGHGSPHQFNADLHLVDWLHERGYAFDVVTDEDLHRDGVDLLEPYSVVLTGSHHEYWSLEMIRATEQYLCGGGRVINFAGNGMYWVTQLDLEHHSGIEIRRRGPATRSWEPEPGEAYLSATGELGGIWRFRGCSPQRWLGIGFTAQGVGEGRPYDRQPASFDPRVAWIFDGVGDDERIGDFASLVNGYGAAGFEIDRADHALGTPHRTHILATASGFSDSYQHVSEEIMMSDSAQGGSVNPLVKADMVLLEYPNGGAVFSPGSISWCACLSYNDYDNNVSRITTNVLDRFTATAANRRG